VSEVFGSVARWFPENPLLFAIQVSEHVEPLSLTEVRSSFEWTTLRQYELDPNVPHHGVLLGTYGWAPPPGAI
jgi:hypothetical protein